MVKRLGLALALVILLIGSVVPSYAWHGYHGYKRRSVVIVPRIVVPIAPFWVPRVYPPVVVAPPPVYIYPAPQVYVQPPPPQVYWYYCDDPSGYYPYVQHCPGGWRQVPPSPPR
ncbi:MAG TPA: hypothetical protein VNP04_20500 [Alphaproteobacteria bacterium]|nr:hypothetical protein [Alphaproteobacteria bacterium]